MIEILQITAPVYAILAAGWLSVRTGWLQVEEMRALGRYVTRICVPVLLFRALAAQPIHQTLRADYLLVYAGASLLVGAAVMAFSRLARGQPYTLAALHGLGSAGSNSAFIGYPIVRQVVGPAADLGLALCTLVENLLILPGAMALADAGRDGNDRLGLRSRLAAIATALLRNPMVLGVVAGLAASAAGLHPPEPLDRGLKLVAGAAAPTALLVIGGNLVGLRWREVREGLALVVGSKLLLHPLAVAGLLMLVPLADPHLQAAAVLFAAMPMLSIYAVLAQPHGHERFCAAALLLATLGSFFSVAAVITLLPANWLVTAL